MSRRQADMRVRTRIEPCTSLESDRAKAVEKDEGPHHPAMPRGQGATDLKAVAEITDSRQDNLLDFGGRRLNGHGTVSPAVAC